MTAHRLTDEMRVIRPDNEIRYVRLTSEAVKNSAHEVTGLKGTLLDITGLKVAYQELVKSLNEKEMMIKEIHHRVKNNLQIVSSLLRLQSDKIEDKKALEYFKVSEERVKSMALIHEQLYKTKDLTRIDFKQYVSDLCSYLFSAYCDTPAGSGSKWIWNKHILA